MQQSMNYIEPGLSADKFFRDYVSQRRPVIIKGLPDDSSFQAQKWTDLDYLSSKAGDTPVLVEPMHLSTRQFGTDVKRLPMQFGQFLQSLKDEGGPSNYLTTQYSGEEWDQLTVLSPPTNALVDDFPAVPRLMGNLLLQQVNLWLGKSQAGSSSGLHHDFHDNLYCLLKGRKRFVLYPPQEHENLYPHKPVYELYKNGVIAYDWVLRADGLDVRVAMKARIDALERNLRDETAVQGKGKGKIRVTAEQKRLEEELDNAREDYAKLAMDEEYGFPLSDMEDNSGEESEEEEEEEEADDDFGSLAGDLEDGQDDYEVLMGNLGDDDALAGSSGVAQPDDSDGAAAEQIELSQAEEPASFSRIPTAYLHKHLNLPTTAVSPTDSSSADFPNLAKARAPYIVELSAGEMLYLPASWWHEVTSSSAAGGEGEGGGEDVHMAFNYWFYPPDADVFEEPYADKLVWEHLREQARKTQNGKGKARAEMEPLPEGKRKREDGEGSSQKKAKR